MCEKTCFVVMGFHKKKDPETGRILDLDKTYRGIIKPAAQASGYKCFRADEIQHAGIIDVPMYEWLYRADLVIADLSTLNANAFFELGVRYALKPRTTIVIAESQFKSPFDTNHITARHYRHDGEALDFEVVEEFRSELIKAIAEIADRQAVDSPVYTFLKDLTPPDLKAAQKAAEQDANDTAQQRATAADTQAAQEALKRPMAQLIDHAMQLRQEGKFKEMAEVFSGLKAIQGSAADSFVVQQLAFATYKSKYPSSTESLLKARDLLADLNPRHSLDAESIGLWGAVHKRLADAPDRSQDERQADLDEAIDALDRGFRLLRDYYNGINAAFLYDLRASRTGGEGATADRVIARRIRTEVLQITSSLLAGPPVGESERDRGARTFWIEATYAEALLGLGQHDEARARLERAASAPYVEAWMLQTAVEQMKAFVEQTRSVE